MSFAELHKRVTFVFAALGFLALALGAELGFGWTAILGLGFFGSWYAEGPRIHSRQWTRGLTALALGSFALLSIVAFFAGGVLDAILGYAGLLQLTRLLQRRTATEHQHVIGLGFLHLLAGTLLSTGLDYALVFLGFVVVAPWMLVLTHLRSEIEAHHATPEELLGPPTEHLARMLASKNLASRGLLLGSSLLSLPLFALTAAFFLVFPRVGLGIFTFGEGSQTQVAGFGNSVDLGGFGTIRDDPTVVARVFPPSLGASPPASASLRLRGTSFERYDGRRWTRAPSPGVRRESRFGPVELFERPLGMRTPRRETIRLVVEPLEGGVVFLPEGTTAIDMRPRIESGLDVPRPLLVRSGLDVRLAQAATLDLEYSALVDPALEGFPERIDDSMRRALLELPPGLERVESLAAEVTGDATEARTIATRILTHLRDSGRYRYSLDLRAPGDENPLVHFLFTSRSGHCELYASAMVVMLRARGVPARNVTGFLGGRYNTFGRYYSLSQGDAHSWVEALVDGRFVTFDPTPSAREAFTPRDDALAGMRALLDAMRMRWSRDVVGYDMRRQVDLLLALRDRLRSFRGRSQPRGYEAVDDEPSDATTPRARRPIRAGLLAATVIVLVGSVAAFAVRRRRRQRRRADEAERLYRELDGLLEARGFARPSGRTPLEHAIAVERGRFHAAAEVRRLTELHAKARYEGTPLTAAERTEAAQLLHAVARVSAQVSPETR